MSVTNHSFFSARLLTCVALLPILTLQPAPGNAREGATIEEIITIGSRSQRARSTLDSTVPIDILTADDFGRIGNAADITDHLKTLVPSYNATTASGDQDTYVRPVSLRGLAPDQTLVLINGKRRHRAALIAEFTPGAGKGAHGPNAGMIPAIAVKNVEVLRDGAAAQYGSDAIAGVINFQLQDAPSGGALRVQYGEFYEGEQSYKVEGNIGLPLGDNGFVNASMEYSNNDALSRGHQRPNAQTLIDNGVQGIGADTPFHDEPFAQTWGRPESENILLFVNSGLAVSDNAELYLHGNYAETDGRYRFFFRNPEFPLGCSLDGSAQACVVEPHSHLRPLRAAGLSGLEAGFTPFFDGDHTDFSLVGGIRGEINDITYDLSAGYGEDELDFFLNNTISRDPTLARRADGSPGQRGFDVGAWTQQEINLNLDLAKPLTDSLHFAMGAEWREETFIVTPGEPASYSGAGASGFKGFVPTDSGSFRRDNYALYGELEQTLGEAMLVQYAVRYEDFSDFGDTINGKLAARYDLSDTVAVRGAVSTGFHAPTPGQSNLRKVTTTFDANLNVSVEEGVLPPDHPLVKAAGGAPLKEEKSVNFSLGFAADLGGMMGNNADTSLTVDFYRIDIDDRIYKTSGAVPAPLPDSVTTDCNDIRALCANISFFTNALDIRSQGVDVALTSSVDWNAATSTDFSFIFNYNEVDVTGQSRINGQQPVSDADVEDIENSYPNERFIVSAFTTFTDRLDLSVRASYYGSQYDQRGTVNGASPSAKLGAEFFVDLELGYNLNENLRLLVGAANLFDEYVDKIRPTDTCGDQGLTCANRWSQGMPYARRAAANYEGGSWYLRAAYNW